MVKPELSDDAKRRDELKTQLAFLFDTVPEYIIVAAVRETMDKNGYVLTTTHRHRTLNRAYAHHKTMCELLVGTLSGIIVELRNAQGALSKRIETLDRLVAIALECVNTLEDPIQSEPKP